MKERNNMKKVKEIMDRNWETYKRAKERAEASNVKIVVDNDRQLQHLTDRRNREDALSNVVVAMNDYIEVLEEKLKDNE